MNYPKRDWNALCKVRVTEIDCSETSRHSRKVTTSATLSNFLIPYDGFYTEDDKYVIKIDFLNKTVDLKVKVAGEDSTYNPPNELARILFIPGVAFHFPQPM